jgi:hypothetical protein
MPPKSGALPARPDSDPSCRRCARAIPGLPAGQMTLFSFLLHAGFIFICLNAPHVPFGLPSRNANKRAVAISSENKLLTFA